MNGFRNAFRGALCEGTLEFWSSGRSGSFFQGNGWIQLCVTSGYWSGIAHDAYRRPRAWLIESVTKEKWDLRSISFKTQFA